MRLDRTGAIDCDFHPRAPTPRALAAYMDAHWRQAVETRGIDAWETIAYPPRSPLTMRPDWRKSGADADPVKAAQATLDRFGFAHAICNCLFPVQAFRDENLAAARQALHAPQVGGAAPQAAAVGGSSAGTSG